MEDIIRVTSRNPIPFLVLSPTTRTLCVYKEEEQEMQWVTDHAPTGHPTARRGREIRNPRDGRGGVMVCPTCMRSLTRSSGAVIVLATAPAAAPPRRARRRWAPAPASPAGASPAPRRRQLLLLPFLPIPPPSPPPHGERRERRAPPPHPRGGRARGGRGEAAAWVGASMSRTPPHPLAGGSSSSVGRRWPDLLGRERRGEARRNGREN